MSMNIGPASLVLTIYFAMFTFLYLVQINPMLWPQNADIASIPCFCAFFALEEREFRFHGWRNVPILKSDDLDPLEMMTVFFFFIATFLSHQESLHCDGLHQKVFTWSSLRNLAENVHSGSVFAPLIESAERSFFLYLAISG